MFNWFRRSSSNKRHAFAQVFRENEAKRVNLETGEETPLIRINSDGSVSIGSSAKSSDEERFEYNAGGDISMSTTNPNAPITFSFEGQEKMRIQSDGGSNRYHYPGEGKGVPEGYRVAVDFSTGKFLGVEPHRSEPAERTYTEAELRAAVAAALKEAQTLLEENAASVSEESLAAEAVYYRAAGHVRSLITDEQTTAFDRALASSQLALEEAWRLGFEHKMYVCNDVDSCARLECSQLSRTPHVALERVLRSAQWEAFDRVLNWVNAQETKTFTRKELYHAVMEMRPATGGEYIEEVKANVRKETQEWAASVADKLHDYLYKGIPATELTDLQACRRIAATIRRGNPDKE